MVTKEPVKAQLQFEDLWDWAYCPLRVWWRRTGLAPDVVGVEQRRTGEQLMRRSVQKSIDLFYRLNREEGESEITPAQALGLVWKAWLEGWSFDKEFSRTLVEYQDSRRRLLQRFEEKGDIRRPDGTLYQRPMWTRYWRELAGKRGITELREYIDRQAGKAGLACMGLPDNGRQQAPMGLADAFAASVDIVSKLDDLPHADNVLGTRVPLIIDLLSVHLHCHADIVVDLGESPARGRPRNDSDGPRMQRKLQYELHIYDPDPPAAFALSRDLRVLALGQALPAELEKGVEEVSIKEVKVRHLRTGTSHLFKPDLSDGADILESIARSVITGIRSGAYVPRMVCGWNACVDCEFRSLCFSDPGVIAAFNPPMMAQIRASQRMVEQVARLIQEGEQWKSGMHVLRTFLEWMGKTPGLSPEGAIWLIDAVEAGSIR